MPTQHLHSLTIVAPAAEAAVVRGLFATLESVAEGDVALPLALTVDGVSVSHYAGHTVITEATRQSLLSLMGGGGVPSGTHYLIVPNDPSADVIGTSLPGFDPTAASKPSELYASMGLVVYDPGA